MEAGKFVNEKLATSVPWEDLVSHGNLQKILHAIVQRLDRFDRTLAPGAVPLAVIPAEEIVMYRYDDDLLTAYIVIFSYSPPQSLNKPHTLIKTSHVCVYFLYVWMCAAVCSCMRKG